GGRGGGGGRGRGVGGGEGGGGGGGGGWAGEAEGGGVARGSRSRQGGRLVGLADSGGPVHRVLGNAHMSATLRERTQCYDGVFFAGTTRMWSSSSCMGSTGLGASSIKSCMLCVFGKAMTSRMFSVPAKSMMMRSMPGAIPPCGGTPYSNASSRKPNRSSMILSSRPSSLNTRF